MTLSCNKWNELASTQLVEKPKNYYSQSITFYFLYKYKRLSMTALTWRHRIPPKRRYLFISWYDVMPKRTVILIVYTRSQFYCPCSGTCLCRTLSSMWRYMYRASYCNVCINQRDTQILVNSLYFFVKCLYMFRTIISPSSGATFNELYSAIVYLTLVLIPDKEYIST